MTNLPEYMQSTIVLASLCYTPEQAMKVAGGWKVSNEVRSALMELLKFRAEKYSVRYLKVLISTGEITEQGAVNYLAFQKRWDDYTELRSWDRPLFPVSGQDVMDFFNASPGPAIGIALKAMKLVWAERDYTSTKSELLDDLASKGAFSI